MKGGWRWIVTLPADCTADHATLARIAEDCPLWGWIVPRIVIDNRMIFLRTDPSLAKHHGPETAKFVVDCLMHKAAYELTEQLVAAGILATTEWTQRPYKPIPQQRTA
jgi:hypothetical protein